MSAYKISATGTEGKITQNTFNPDSAHPVLILDLDRTLSVKDTLLVQFFDITKRNPFRAAACLALLVLHGRIQFKRACLEHAINWENIPLNREVLEISSKFPKENIILATASLQESAIKFLNSNPQIPEHLKQAHVIGSSSHTNLKGKAKALALSKTLNLQKFRTVFVTDSKSDIPTSEICTKTIWIN